MLCNLDIFLLFLFFHQSSLMVHILIKNYGDISHNLKKKNDGSDEWLFKIILRPPVERALPFILILQVDTLFEMNSPLCWQSVMIGYYSSAYIGCATVGGIVGAKLMKFCLTDQMIALAAGLMGMLYSIFRGMVVNTAMMFCGKVWSYFILFYSFIIITKIQFIV